MIKQHFASKTAQTCPMQVSALNKALAENLEHHMARRGLTQMALAKKCGVGQTTISLYLHPERRKLGKDGKPGSAKLTEVEMLAAALEVESWELLRPLDGVQRDVYERIAAAYKLLNKDEHGPKQLASVATPTSKPAKTERA